MNLIHRACTAQGTYIALVMAIGFLIFYALPDGIPFLVRLTMMVATQVGAGKVLNRVETR